MACLCLWSNSKMGYLLVLLWFILMTSFSLGSAQSDSNSSCASDLVSCASYMNTTETPPSSCCDSIKNAVKTELTCLCTLYETPNLLASIGVNVTQALQLTQRCGVSTDLSTCSKSAGAPNSAPPPPVSGNDGNRIALTGFSSLLVVLASLLMH